MLHPLEKRLLDAVDSRAGRLVAIVQDLVRIPSENTPPTGAEEPCQRYCEAFLQALGWETTLYEPSSAPDAERHPLWWHGRDYRGRPNLAARRAGQGSGRSLVVSGHIDTVPAGTLAWKRRPFGGEVEGNRLYGRGSNDMKGGIACNLFVAELLAELGIRLDGDLTIESVVDEEFGGVNGTIAGRLMGFNADAAVISEPSFLRICPAQRGGMTAHVTLHAQGGIMNGKEAGVVEQMRLLLDALPEFAVARRNAAPHHPLYCHCPDPVPVDVMKVATGPFSVREPMGKPEACSVELFWQAMPGESCGDVRRQFDGWLTGVVARHRGAFPTPPDVHFPLRWLPGSAISAQSPLVANLALACQDALCTSPRIEGIEAPCDMFAFHEFGIPAVLWGGKGGNTHGSDEFVEIDSLVGASRALIVFLARWCGAQA